MKRTVKIFSIIALSILAIYALQKVIMVAFRPLNYFRLASLPEINRDIGGVDFSFSGRILLHRVDSTERILFAKERYDGFEIDVVFDLQKAVFDVGHPPEPSINLDLSQLIQSVSQPDKYYYWIDFKNLSQENKELAKRELLSISATYDIKQRMIIESTNPEHLDIFHSSGFITSYYINPDQEIDYYHLRPEMLRSYVKEIEKHLESGNISALSADHANYEFLHKYFARYPKLLWNIDENSVWMKVRNLRLLYDPSVKILLVPEWSPGYR